MARSWFVAEERGDSYFAHIMEPTTNDSFLGVLEQLSSSNTNPSTFIEFSPGNSIEVTVSFDDIGSEPPIDVVERAEKVFVALQSREKEFHRALVDEYLEDYNLIGINHQPVDEAEFIRRIKWDSIFLGSDGSAYLYFLAEELEDYFGDHAISMRISADMRIGPMNLEG